jgi:hypothetical protein
MLNLDNAHGGTVTRKMQIPINKKPAENKADNKDFDISVLKKEKLIDLAYNQISEKQC